MSMEQTWRWYGPKDNITLKDIRQTGATGVVTALHHIPNGEVWEMDEILERKKEIEKAGLTWSVVESVPVHEAIKKQTPGFQKYIENYKVSIRNLGAAGIKTICYNFMPIIDWSRTDLAFQFADGSLALKYEQKHFAAFELFILKREGAEADYTEKIQKEAKEWFATLNDKEILRLEQTIIKGLPGAEESYSIEDLKKVLAEYKGIDKEKLKEHLKFFLDQIIPVAEESNVLMAIHPDDPPWSLMGLPRVVSRIEDLRELINHYNSPNNGLTFCTGSLGAGYFNDLSSMASELSHRINFAHLRNVTRDEDLNFYEDYLFEGDVDIHSIVKSLVLEEEKRKKEGRADWKIPFRPDHGNQMFEDVNKSTNPGYSLFGRMKGLAELRGLELGIRRSL